MLAWSRAMKWACASLMLMIVGAASIISCSDANTVRGRAVDRQDGKIASAMVTEDGGGGATVPWVQRVYVGRGGTHVEVLRAVRGRDLTIRWSGDRRLTIRMTCGEILSFTNFVDTYSDDRKDFQRIEIELNVNGLCSESWPPGS